MSEDTQDDFTASPQPDPQAELQSLASNASPENEQANTEESAPVSAESTLPPEAQGEANGGPLGCCLGGMIGLLLSGVLLSLSLTFISHIQGGDGLLGWLARILLSILAFALLLFFVIIGWRLGKRIFREYDPPAVKERERRTRQPRRSRTKKVQQEV